MAKAAWSWDHYSKEQSKKKLKGTEAREDVADDPSVPAPPVMAEPAAETPTASAPKLVKGGKRQSGGWRDDLVDPRVIDTAVGLRIRELRILRGLSQQAMGKALGLSFQQLQKYEHGGNRIGAGRLAQISQILDVPVSALFDVEHRSHKDAAPTLSRKAIAVATLFDQVDTSVADAAFALLKASVQLKGDTGQ